MSRKLAVAVIGVGYLGRIHARIYARMAEVDLVGVVDTDPQVAKTVAEDCGCPGFTDAGELPDSLQAVSIVVPTSLHAAVAGPFLERGVHVMMEKPIAPGFDESRTLVKRAEAAGVIFQVGHLERFNSGVRMLMEQIRRPRFLEVHRMSPFLARATDVDVVTDLMIHDIDIVLSLVPSSVQRVSAVGVPVVTDHVDIANARLEFEDGAVANLTASRVSENKFRRIRIFEDHRYEALNFVDQQVEAMWVERGENGAREVVRDRWPVEPKAPLDEELAAFVRCVRTGEQPLVDGWVALEAQRISAQVVQEMRARS